NDCIHEVHKSSGLLCGSNKINEQFERMLVTVLGSDLWREFRKECSSSYIDLMQKFELRKRETTIERTKAYNIPLSFAFIQFFTSKKVSVMLRMVMINALMLNDVDRSRISS